MFDADKHAAPFSLSGLAWIRATTVLTSCAFLAMTLLAWHSVRSNQNNQLAEAARDHVQSIAARLDAHLKFRISLAALIEEEWRNGLIADAQSFRFLASTKLNYFDDLQAINWVDPDGIIRWVTPLAGNRAAVGLNLRELTIPGQTLAASERERDIQFTPPITLAQGGKGFVGYSPVFTNGTLNGFINIVFRTAPLIKNALPKDYDSRVNIWITDDGADVFSSMTVPIGSENTAPATIRVHNRTWTVTGELTAAEIARYSSSQAEWILFGGLGFTLIVSYLVWLAMRHHYSIQNGERRFADFADVSSDWFWETDAALRFSYFSDRFEDTTGVAPETLLGRTRAQTGAPGSDPSAYADLLQCLQDRQPFRDFEHLRHKANGETVYLAISGKPAFGPNGEFVGFRGIGRDITRERKSREALNKALIESEKVNQAKSEFLATISHEFRTPLNAILGFSEMFRAEYFGPLGSDKYQQYATDIHDSGKHMLALINDILDISAIEARKRPLHFEPVQIAEIAEDCVRNFEHKCREKNLALTLDMSTTLPRFAADKRATVQILLNLISNAVKFTPPGGAIVVSAHVSDSDMIITVNDTGIGIADDKIERIVEPFFQTNPNPHIAQEGTGLGLSIIKLLIEAHSGNMKITSKIGEGTTVTVRLPMTHAH